jgi:hypothetical protein
MRHIAISEQGVDFEEHYARKLWVAWSHGTWKNRHVGAYENPLCCSVRNLIPPDQITNMFLNDLRR